METIPDFLERYQRQIQLPDIGPDGQRRLLAWRTLVVGLGGLGSPAALYLAAAGVGTIGLMDPDTVALSNLQRQILYGTADLGRNKARAAEARLKAIDDKLCLDILPMAFDESNAGELVAGYDFVIDATDQFAAKFLIARACHAAGKPYVHAGVLRHVGQAMTVLPGRTVCPMCLFEDMPPPDDSGPVEGPLGPLPGMLGAIQAAEAIKCALGAGQLLINRLLVCDLMTMDVRVISLRRRPDCPLCGAGAPGNREEPAQG